MGCPGSSEFESYGSWAAVMFRVNGHLTVLSPRSARRAAANQNVLECGAATSGVGVGGQASAERPEHTCVATRGLGPGAREPLVSTTVCSRGAGQEEGWPGAESRPAPWGCPVVCPLSKERAPQGRVNILPVKQPSAFCFWGREKRAQPASDVHPSPGRPRGG